MKRSTLFSTAIVVVIVIVLLGLFYLPYWSVRNKTIAAFDSEQLILANQAIKGVESFFATYTKALDYFAGQPSIIDLDDSGRMLMEDFLSIHAAELTAVTRIDADGRIVYTTPAVAGAVGQDVSNQAHNRLIMQTHQPVVSDVFTAVQGYTSISLAYPVFKHDEYAGSIGFLIPYDRIVSNYMKQVLVADRGFAMMLSRNGVILYCPSREHVGLKFKEFFAGEPELLNLIEKMLTRRQGSLSFTAPIPIDGGAPPVTRYAVYVPVELPGDNYWSIVVASPENNVLATMRGFRNQWFMVTAAALCAVLLLSYLLTLTLARNREERSRRSAEKQLVRLLDFAPMGLIVYGHDSGELVYANKAAFDFFGRTSEYILGTSVFELIHQDSREFVVGHLAALGNEESNVTATIQVEPPGKGVTRDVEISTARLMFSGQDSYMSIFRDVSEEIQQEANQRRLATVIEQTDESVVITNQAGEVEYVNPAFTEISGYESDEIIGRNPRILKSGLHDDHFYRQLWDTVTSGNVWKGRIVNRRKNGELYTEMATISPVRDAAEKITHYVAVKRDISHEVELEDKLRQAQKMEAIGTLAGGIAHDFNNILGAILGFTDMALLQSDPDAEIHDSLLHIRKAGKRAADLVQQILTFSRLSTTEKQEIVVADLVRESLQLLRASLPSTITIHQDLQADGALVLANATQLQQIVINLCTNAFQAMREHGGELTIRLEELPFTECGNALQLITERCIRLIVADTGAGIEPAVLERIFDPFFTTKEPGEGTGMGLSVVHGIILDLGGEITVESTVGSGAVFTVLLPAAEPAGGKGEALHGPLPMGTEHILVVDDEEDILITSKMMLSHLGYTVSVNMNPAMILEQIEKGEMQCDLVVTDQTMPQMTGLDFVRGLQRLQPELPVIVCTGYSDRVNESSVRDVGGAGLLMKPVELRDLAIMIRNALDEP